MVNIKRKQSSAYILWESLLATAVLASLASLLLGQLNHHCQQLKALENKTQALSVANMAVQSGQSQLELNGQTVTVSKNASQMRVFVNGKECFSVKHLSP